MTKPKSKSDVFHIPLNYNLSEDQDKPDYELEDEDKRPRRSVPNSPGKKLRNKEFAKSMKQEYPDYTLSEYRDFLRIFQIVLEKEITQGNAVLIEDLGVFYPFKGENSYRYVGAIHGKNQVQWVEGVMKMKFTLGFNAAQRIRLTDPFKGENTYTLKKRTDNFTDEGGEK